MKVELSYHADQEYSAVNETGNRVEIDMKSPEDKNAQSPMQLLLSALLGCAAVDIVSMVKKRRKTLLDLKGIADGNRKEEHPKRFTAIHLHYKIFSPDLTEEEAERIVDLATTKYCSVASSVSSNQTHSFEIIKE